MTLVTRASSVPALLKAPCAEHPLPGELLVNQSSDASELGTAAHDATATLVTLGSIDYEQITALAMGHRCDVDELKILVHMARKLWTHDDVCRAFPYPETEVALFSRDGRVTGTADVLSVSYGARQAVVVGDWKFGIKDHDYSPQLKTYAALGLERYPEAVESTGTIFWVRAAEVESYTMLRDEGESWLKRVRDAVDHWNGIYRTGAHCEWCQRVQCPARAAVARANVDAMGAPAPDLLSMRPDDIIELREKAAMVSRLSAAVLEQIRKHVIEHGELVGSETTLRAVESTPRELDFLKGFPALQDAGFSDDDMAAVCKLSLSRAEDLVAKRAPKRGGAAAVRALGETLENAGAIKTTTRIRLETRRTGT